MKNKIIRGINIFWYYKKKKKIYKFKNYIKYVNNIQITWKYNFLSFKNIIYIINKNNISLTINLIFTKKNFNKNLKLIKILSKRKKYYIKICLISNNHIYDWFLLINKILFFIKMNKINNLIIINYPLNKIGYPNNIILNSIKKIFKNKKNILSINIDKIKYNKINNIIQLLNCMINNKIKICIDKINYINKIQLLLNFCQKKKIGWWTIPNKKIKHINKNNYFKNKKIKFTIINCKNGIRQTSIK